MTSDVGRGLRDEGPVRAHSSREWNAAGAPPRGGPEHPLSSPRVRAWLEGRARLGEMKPGTTKILVPAAPREGGCVSEDQGAWNRSVSRVPVKGHPFEPVDRPPPDAAPRGALPKWRASAGSAFSSRLTLNG